MTSVEEMKRMFVSLTKEEQFKFYVVLNDCKDHYENMLNKSKSKIDKEKYGHIFSVLNTLSQFFTEIDGNPLMAEARQFMFHQADKMIEEKTTYKLVDKGDKK